jgi:GH15 family glucan-1,4-alpha-glucosidase
MPLRIEDYALIGDCHTAALVGRDGSIDWYCPPRFDAGACFAALLGKPSNGRWLIAPANRVHQTRRRYCGSTLILETEFESESGTAALIDFMSMTSDTPLLVRIVEGKSGQVPMRTELIFRFDYGSLVPWVRRVDGALQAIAGPDMLRLCTDVELRGENFTTLGEFTVRAGQKASFALAWHPSHQPPPVDCPADLTLRQTEEWWNRWVSQCTYKGPRRDLVVRSLLTLKAITYRPTGGIIAAPTTSLPEVLGGERNWDYRYCWLRDSTFTLYALLNAGFKEEAEAWREWLLRALAGEPSATQIMYGLGGERRLTEIELHWLSGYENSRPVRIGNAASGQFQLDVYGELIDSLYQCRNAGLPPDEAARNLELALLEFLETAWERPDDGIWEVRGPRRHFTHSKVMAWVAFDRAIKGVEKFNLQGPVDRWRKIRNTIHEQVCQQGFDRNLNAFVQFYGSKELDASALMIPLVGFLPAEDPRVVGTLTALEQQLLHEGFVRRYRTESDVDGLSGHEGAFLPCTFWYADNLYLMGRHDEAKKVFTQLTGLCNDVGLISEEYDYRTQRLVGNFPQAFTHISLVNTACNLSPQQAGPAEQRSL